MIRIVAFADSLSLARPREDDREAVYWEETWPWYLERLFERDGMSAEVINCGERDRTVESFMGTVFDEHITWKLPNIVVVQLGVVDCGPRVLSRLEKRLLNLPGFPARLRDTVIRRRAAKRDALTAKNPLARVDVSPARFEACIETLDRRLNALPARPLVYWVPIVFDPDRMRSKSPAFATNVDRYNGIIRRYSERGLFHWVDFAPSRRDFWGDGYHLSAEGNRLLADTLHRAIRPIATDVPSMPRRYFEGPKGC